MKKYMDRVGVMTLDAGTTSGLTWGVYEPGGSTADVIKRGLRMTAQVESNVGETIHAQEFYAAKIIATRYMDLRFRWMMAGIPYGRQIFVFEDFVLRPGKNHSSERTGLSSPRIVALIMGMLARQWEDIVWVGQQPSEAKGYATDYRLREWGLWVRGEQHSRDAMRHLALWIAKNL